MVENHPDIRKQEYRGIACLVLSAFCFALMSMFVHLAGDLPSMQKSFFRNLVAALSAVVLLLRAGESFRIRRENLPYFLMRSIFGTMGVLCNFYAVDHLVLADASILNKMSPFFTVLFSWLILKEKVMPIQLSLIFGAFLGSIFVVKPTFSNLALVPSLLGFFGVEYSEDAPYASPVGSAYSPQGPPVRTGTEELGDGVTASYFVAPESDTVPRYGFFFGGEGVWVEDGGGFVQLETRRFDEVLTVQGEEVRLTFDYAVHGGVCALTWFDPGQLWLDWMPVSRFSSPEAVLLMRIVDAERYCPVLLDLRTGEYADVLGETGLSAYWSSDGWVAPDGSGALIRMEDACYDWYDAR